MRQFRLRSALLILLVGCLALAEGCATTDIDVEDEQNRDTRAAESNVQLGIGYMRSGNNGVAMEKFKRALEEDPDLPAAHHYIAVLYDRLQQEKPADKHYRRSIRLAPDNARFNNNYGQFLCDHERYEEAEERFQVASRDPLYEGRALVLTNAGICARRANDLEKSVRFFKRALAITPDYAPALFQMMKTSYERKEYLKARAYLERYRSFGPVTAESLWWGMRVERALGDENAAASYALRLKAEYPNSVEARQLMENR